MAKASPDEIKKYLERAIELAVNNVQSGLGGPFGCVIVKDGKIIAEASNQVTGTSDPTAHAEVQAIRKACQFLQHFQLENCDVYASCEPCPMCLGALYWARPRAVYFSATKLQAAHAGFDDDFIYQELATDPTRRKMPLLQQALPNSNLPFLTWMQNSKKIEY